MKAAARLNVVLGLIATSGANDGRSDYTVCAAELIGVGLFVAGMCYTINSFATFLSPGLASQLFPWLLLPGFLAEAALTLWLLIAGVNVDGANKKPARRVG